MTYPVFVIYPDINNIFVTYPAVSQ